MALLLGPGATTAALEIINLGTDWSAGERLFGYSSQNAAGQKLELLSGSTAAPDEGVKPPAVISRVLKVPEASFSGDGAGNLAGLRVHTTAVAGSEGQAIGIVGTAITLASYEAGHSLSDAVGGYFVGISKGTSTRTGLGVFANGRTEIATGRATGIECSIDNESETSESYTGVLPRLKGMHVHATGTANSAAGIVIGKPTSATLHTGIGVVNGAVTDTVFRDDSEAIRSIRIRGKHEKAAISVAAEAGPVIIGQEEAANASSLFEVNGGAVGKDPLYVFRTTGSTATRGQLVTNGSGNVSAFVAGGTNSFVTGSSLGDAGFTFAAGKTLHFGAAGGKASQLRVAEAGLGFFGTAPAAKPTGVAKTAEAIWTALNTLGLIA